MSVNINLVDNKNSESTRREKVKKFRAISFGVLFLTAFLSVIIFAIDYRFSASYVQKQEAELLSELEPLSETSAKVFILNSKLSDISKILNSRSNYSEKVKLIENGNNGNISIEEFKIDSNGTKLSFSSFSLVEIDEYLNYLIGLASDEQILGILLNSLTADENGYKVELSII